MAVPPTPRYGIDFPATLGPETETPPPAETPLAVTSTTGDRSLESLYQQAEDLNRRREEFYRKQFETAQQALMEQRMGPSLSERLGHLSAAFFAPKRMRGYAGAMDKIMPVLNADNVADREGAEQRAAALRELQEKYGERGLMSEDALLQHNMKLAELRQDMEEKRQPKIIGDAATGNMMVVPTMAGVARPKSAAEYDLLDPGTPFIFWEGPEAGRLGRKGEGG